MKCGLGNSQYWMRCDYEKKRRKALERRDKYDDEYLDKVEVEFPLGGNKTNYHAYQIKQFPFPSNEKVRSRKTIDFRKVPWLGIGD